MHVESALEDGIHVSKLTELHAVYENHLKNLNTFSANRTRLKGELLDYFQDNGIQKQSDGNNVVLKKPIGMYYLLQNVALSYSEALQLAAVAKKIRQEIFQVVRSY